MAKPLEGLLVIELATYWVGPSAGAYLRAQGARVIKIEQPPYGDSTRFFARTCGVPYTDAENPIHDVSNGGKECITLDLKDEENIKLLHRMLAKADVFLTSVRQAGLERLGLDYDSIKDKYPRLIYAHGTAYGKSGPLSSYPGLDAVAFFGINGMLTDNMMTEDGAICPITGMGDFTTGGYLDIGIMTALYNRERTGRGDYVMTSLYGVGGWVSQNCAIGTQYYDPWPRSRWTQSPMGQAYKTKDGKYVQIFVNEYEKRWDAFCAAFGIEDLHDDARFNTRTAVNDPENCRKIVERCAESALRQTGDELLAKLRAGNIPACINGHFSDKYKIPEQIEHNLVNGYFVPHTYDGEGASGKSVYVSQFPLYFESQGVTDDYARCHALDEDREKILAGFST